jgi:hypothetical protein
MFSLASLRYRDVLSSKGGPIDRIETISINRHGRAGFEANAYLREDLAPKRSSILFGAVDGSGANTVASVARHKAVSEAIERWALIEGLVEFEKKNWGLGVDPTSNGFAAYPGISARQARQFAWLEAVERWTLFAWWEGLLRMEAIAAPAPGVNGMQIRNPFSCAVVLLFSKPEEGHYAYGYAAGVTAAAACEHALTELDRHAEALRRKPAANGKLLSQHESRALFFGCAEGFSLFEERVARSAQTHTHNPRPTMAFDGEVCGPWSRYAHVWRVLFHPPSDRFLNEGRGYFWW